MDKGKERKIPFIKTKKQRENFKKGAEKRKV